MSFSMAAENPTFRLNPGKVVKRALPRLDNVNTASPDAELEKLKATFERNLVSATSRTMLPLDYLLQTREPYIRLRNSILDNPLKFLDRRWKERLAEVDGKLDEIDLEIYELVGNRVPQKDLEQVIADARATVQEAIRIATNTGTNA